MQTNRIGSPGDSPANKLRKLNLVTGFQWILLLLDSVEQRSNALNATDMLKVSRSPEC